jgi:uncharacterized protein YjbJ (UPF0337 family)
VLLSCSRSAGCRGGGVCLAVAAGGAAQLDDPGAAGAEKLVGQAKKKAGEATRDDSQQADGQADQAQADLKQAAENAKDTFRK